MFSRQGSWSIFWGSRWPRLGLLSLVLSPCLKSQLPAPGSVCAERYGCISPGSPGVPGHFSAHIFRVVFLVEDALISPFLWTKKYRPPPKSRKRSFCLGFLSSMVRYSGLFPLLCHICCYMYKSENVYELKRWVSFSLKWLKVEPLRHGIRTLYPTFNSFGYLCHTPVHSGKQLRHTLASLEFILVSFGRHALVTSSDRL